MSTNEPDDDLEVFGPHAPHEQEFIDAGWKVAIIGEGERVFTKPLSPEILAFTARIMAISPR